MKRIVIAIFALFVLPLSLNAQDYKYEFSVSYGMLSNSLFYDTLSGSIGGRNQETGQSRYGDNRFIGPLSFEYYNRATRLWSFGVTGVLFDINADVTYTDKIAEIINASILAGAKMHWLNTQYFNMYSKFAIGIAVSAAKETSIPIVLPNFQLSLLGMEVMFTRQFGIFAEAGVGEQGIVHGGMCFKM